MIGRLIKQQKIRLLKKQTNKCNLCLFSAGKGGKLSHLILFLKAKAGKQPVILLFVGKTFPVKGITAGAGRQKLLFHRLFSVRKRLLVQCTCQKLSRNHNSRPLPFIIPIQWDCSLQKTQQCGFPGSIGAHNGYFFISFNFKINVRQNQLPAHGHAAVCNLI